MFASDLSEERRTEISAKIAKQVVKFRLTPMAIVLIEAFKPLSFVGNQLLVFFAPMVGAFTTSPIYDEITAFFEDRTNLELLIQKIEEHEANWGAEAKKARKLKKEAKQARREKRGKRK